MTLTFSDLGLSTTILDALTAKGFEHPTPIQAATIPLALSEPTDIIGQAQTGTGKTAAFGLPILDTLTATPGPIQALIMTPTRELTIQVAKELNELKGNKHLTITPIYGGQSISLQIRQLKKPSNHIIVGTPGRLIDHLKGKKLDLSQIQYLVLDEADEMLNTGFLEDIEKIMASCNPDRKTFLFSATMPAPIAKLAQKYMNAPKTVEAKKETLATTLTTQVFYEMRASDKLEALCRLMDTEPSFYGLIFCRTKRDVDDISEALIHRGYAAEGMHGDLSQFQRERVLNKFRKQICTVLVVTDVASRGLDISGLSHVVNYALPQDAESYVHRVGRTGRAGKPGTAISFITPSEFGKLKHIQKIAKTDIPKAQIPEISSVIAAKKQRVSTKILDTVSETIEDQYQDLAADLLKKVDPKDLVAAILKTAYKTELSETAYAKISRAPRPRGKKTGFFQKQKNKKYRDRRKRY